MRFRNALAAAALLFVPLAVSVTAALAVKTWVVQAFEVPSESMEPTLTTGDHIFVSKLHAARPSRGDVVVFRLDDPAGPFFVKRVIAVPGDCIQIGGGRVRVNGHTLAEPYLANSWTSGHHESEIVPPESYFVMGDNRSDSIDSRVRGFVPSDSIVGTARLIYWSARDRSSLPAANAQSADDGSSRRGGVRWERILRRIE